ncbi:MarR family transcriptional regulator [Microlunatus spumicola]|uniref:MarR family transcriptional regulator n=1 Tax=Microlunatus spumicola TaxID=81499 RepID=A0ABP6WJE1_9ACTN
MDPADYLPTDPEPCLRLDDQLCFALYAATNAVVRSYRPLLLELGLTYPQYLVMMALWEKEDLSVGDLGARLDLPVSGITPVLDRLDRAGLLDRRRGTPDRRVVLVALTDAGRALEEQAAKAQHQVRCQTLLTPDALANLRDELQDLVRVMAHDAA